MLDLQGVKNIIFDLGGVILNIDYQLTSSAFKNLGIDNFDTIYSQAKQNNLFDRLETGNITEESFRDTIRKYKPDLSDQDIDAAWNAMLLNLPPERVELLSSLKSNYRIFLLSNTNSIHIRAFNQILQKDYPKNLFDQLFEKHYFSSEIGYRKPDIACFQYVLKENNIKASETLFIDDSSQHILGAKKVELKTHYLQPGEDIVTLFPGKVQ